MKIQSEIDGWELYITENNNDLYVQEFIFNVSNENIRSSRLTDNPYTFDRLINFNRKYNILWLYKDEPVYGFFAVQYDKLPANIIRLYTRMYKLNRKSNKFTRSFLMQENKMYSIHLKNLFQKNNIDTIFFTRHLNTTSNDLYKWKDKKRVNQFMNVDINIVENVKFRNIDQTVYYYNAWQPEKKLDHSFISLLKDI